MLLLMFISLFTSRLVLNALGVIDYGIYNVVGGVVSLMGILNSTMATSTQRYLTFEIGTGNNERVKQIFSTSILIFLFLSLILVLLSETLGLWYINNNLQYPTDRQIAVNFIFQFTILSCVCALIKIPYNASIISYEKMNIFAYISILEAVFKLSIVYGLLILSGDKLILYTFLYLLVDIIITSIYILYCRSKLPNCKFSFVKDTSLFKELLAFSSWTLIESVASLLKTQGVSLLLNFFFGAVVNASRGLSVQIYNAINQFSLNFYTAARPQITKYYSKKDYDAMATLMFRSSKLSFYLVYILALPMFAISEFVIKLWLNEVPMYMVGFTRLLIINGLIDTLAFPLVTVILASGRIKNYQLTCGIFMLFIVPTTYILFAIFKVSAYYAFYTTIAFSVIAYIYRIVIASRRGRFKLVDYIQKVIIPLTLLVSVTTICIYYITQIVTVIDFMSLTLFSVLYVLIITPSILLIGLTKNERTRVIKGILTYVKKC